MTIRRARVEDASAMGATHVAVWRAADSEVFVAAKDDVVVGMASIGRADDSTGEHRGQLHMINVRPEAFGTGVGIALHAAALAALATRGHRKTMIRR